MVITTADMTVRQGTSPSAGELLLVADAFVMCDNPGVVI